MKRIAMIAFHFPPSSGSSGVQRTLRFAQQLPSFGWEPAVLTASARAYENTSDDLLREIPRALIVRRAFALDARRHLSAFQRYPGWLARPDRWLTWLFGALATGMRMIRQFKPDVLWSTYPIATAHLIGYWLARLSGIAWLADFRDPMAHDGYPVEPKTWQSYLRTEQRVFSRARHCVFTTRGSALLYRQRYPEVSERISVIENGYDEEAFRCAEQSPLREALNAGRVTLLHSGVVYPEWRNPQALFEALRRLIDCGDVDGSRLCLRFRAPGNMQFVSGMAERYGLGGLVQVLPAIAYGDSLVEMLRADGLLLLQSRDCNDQIPAKTYEYLRAGRPILGLTDAAGDTAQTLSRAGFTDTASLDSSAQIAGALKRFLAMLGSAGVVRADPRYVTSLSRLERTREFALLLDTLVAPRALECL